MNLGYCQIHCKQLHRYCEWLLIISAAIGFSVQMYLHGIFIGIRQIGTETVVSNTPGIMLSVFEDWSFWLFRVSTNFHLFLAMNLICKRCLHSFYMKDDKIYRNEDYKDNHDKKNSLVG